MPDSTYPAMPSIEINNEGIAQLFSNIDPFKAMGPDGLPSRLLKELSNELAPCLSTLFRASLHQSTIPGDWRTALVTPLHKKGSCSDPSNYHPISLTSICCKVFEHVIYSNVMLHLEKLNILSVNQFGFRARCSAKQQLLRTIHDLTLNLNNKMQKQM